jgi:hypothetical protein
MKATLTKIGNSEQLHTDIWCLNKLIEQDQSTCEHKRVMQWKLNWQGKDGTGNACEDCGKSWFMPDSL